MKLKTPRRRALSRGAPSRRGRLRREWRCEGRWRARRAKISNPRREDMYTRSAEARALCIIFNYNLMSALRGYWTFCE